MGSAVAMDKVMSKALFKELRLNVADYTYIGRSSWIDDPKRCIKEIKNVLKFPMFVKPANIGSSIGVGKAVDEDSLSFAIEVATAYSDKIIIEEALEDVIEVNCSAIGSWSENRWPETSVCEQPIKSEDHLSFSDKYMKGGKGSKGAGMASLSRIIPAPISKKLTEQIQLATRQIFQSLGEGGVIRVDYFVDTKKEKFWANEVNSPPGSLAFYLWEKSGISYKELLDMLIEMALERAKERKKTTYVFESGLLEMMASGKGIKGTKSTTGTTRE